MWKKSGDKIISGLVGALVTLIIFIFGFSGVVTHDDIANLMTKEDVIALIPEESEYIKDQRMILSHIESTKETLNSLVEKVSDLDKTMATLITKIDNLPIHNFPNSLTKQDR